MSKKYLLIGFLCFLIGCQKEVNNVPAPIIVVPGQEKHHHHPGGINIEINRHAFRFCSKCGVWVSINNHKCPHCHH